jgi:hypothetical protein
MKHPRDTINSGPIPLFSDPDMCGALNHVHAAIKQIALQRKIKN